MTDELVAKVVAAIEATGLLAGDEAQDAARAALAVFMAEYPEMARVRLLHNTG